MGARIKTVSEALLDKAEIRAVARKADLIVIGMHGRQGLSLGLTGSITEASQHGCNVPLLVVRGKQVDEGDA